MQQVLNVATDGYGEFEKTVLQKIATEAFLRGCRNKESASLVLISTPKTTHEACQRLKTIVANKKKPWRVQKSLFRRDSFLFKRRKESPTWKERSASRAG